LQIYILWDYKALHGKNQGRMCFYCMRVFKARYAGIYKIWQLVDKIGTDKEFNTEFMSYRKEVIDRLVAVGSHDARVDWDKTNKKVLQSFAEGYVEVEDPVDEIWQLDDYTRAYGDYKTNGMGHRHGTVLGRSGIIIPGKKVVKVFRRQRQGQRLETDLDNGDFEVGENQLDSKFGGMINNLFGSLSGTSGISMDEILARKESADRLASSSGPFASCSTPSPSKPGAAAFPIDEDDKLAGYDAGQTINVHWKQDDAPRVPEPLTPAGKISPAGKKRAASKAKPASSPAVHANGGDAKKTRGRP
jgi:hypothetical protein